MPNYTQVMLYCKLNLFFFVSQTIANLKIRSFGWGPSISGTLIMETGNVTGICNFVSNPITDLLICMRVTM